MKVKCKSKWKLKSTSEKTVTIVAYVFMTLLGLICILPCLNIFSKAISSGDLVVAGKVYFWPSRIQFDTVRYIFTETEFFVCLKNTVIVAVFGTAISMLTTILTAYPLSKPEFRGRKFITMLYVLSMVFFGGIVPAYMVINTLGLLDTYLGVILPFAIVQFNMFVVKSYFEGLPDSIEEAAYIDGATDFQVLFRVVLPMSTPIIATVSLLYGVNYWNNYFHAMMYTSSPSMRTLQVYLYDIINNGQALLENLYSGAFGSTVGQSMVNITSEGVTAAAVTLSIIPIIAIYPFVQKYLIKGITIGSVKG